LERSQAVVERGVELDAIPLQAPQIFAFIVSRTVLPAAPKNAHPFKGDHANGGPPAFAFGKLLVIEQPGPLALADRTLGKLDNALVIKDRTSVAELNDSLASTL